MKAYRETTVELCECGHPSQDHDPWPDCHAVVGKFDDPYECVCRDWRPVR